MIAVFKPLGWQSKIFLAQGLGDEETVRRRLDARFGLAECPPP